LRVPPDRLEPDRPPLELARPRLDAERPRLEDALLRPAPDLEREELDPPRDELDLERDDEALPRAELPLRLDARPRAEPLPRDDVFPRLELALLRADLVFRPPDVELPRAASARLRTALPASFAALPTSAAPLAAVFAVWRTPFAVVPALRAAELALFAADSAVRRACRRFFCACFTCRVAAPFLPRAEAVEAVLLLRVRVVCLRCRVAAAFFPADLRLALDRDFACAMVSRLPPAVFGAPADALSPSPPKHRGPNREKSVDRRKRSALDALAVGVQLALVDRLHGCAREESDATGGPLSDTANVVLYPGRGDRQRSLP
jgi:hypothetical protein